VPLQPFFLRRLLVSAFALIAGSFPLFPLSADAPPRLTFFPLSVDAGLSNDSVYCLLQDRRGFVWLGTFGGLNRYDGKEVVAYKPGGADGFSLSASVVFALAEGAGGTLWVGTDGGGLDRLDPENGRVEVFRGPVGDSEGLNSDLVYALASEEDGDLWIGTGGDGLLLRSEATGAFVHFGTGDDGLPSNVVRSLLLDGAGRLWVGCANGGLVVVEDVSAERPAFRKVPLAGAGGAPTVRALHEDGRGRVWAGLEGDGVFVVDGRTFGAERVRLPAGVGGDRATVRALSSDAEGRVWAGTEGEGIAIFSAAARPVAELHGDARSRSAVAGDQVRAIMRDHGGLMWVGFKDRGVSIGNPAAAAFGLREAGAPGGLPAGTVRGFGEDAGGVLWIASDGGGLVSYDEKRDSYRAYGPESGLENARVCAVLPSSDGSVYAGTDGGGLFRLDPRRRALTPVQLGLGPGTGVSPDGGTVVWALYADVRGSLWVGLEGAGLVELRADGTRRRYRYDPASADGLAGRSVRCLLEDPTGKLLVGTWDGGLHRIDPETGAVRRFPTGGASSFATSDVSIYCLYRDSSGRVWIGTGSGLDRLVRDAAGDWVARVQLGPLPKRPGVFGIAEDAYGFLWLSTEAGILRYDPERGTVRSWTRGDGLQDDLFAPGASLRLADGRFAFGGAEGFNLFDPSAVAVADPPPPVRIMSLLALEGGGPPERGAVIPGDGSTLRVSYTASGFSLTVAVLDFIDPDKNVHAVRIEGPRDQRFNLGFSNTAVVPRLAPGRYRFIAAGAGNRSVWNDEGSSVTVVIVPPFWATPAFLSSLAGALALGVFGAFRLRVRALERRTRELREISAHIHDAREEERTEIAREVHDELGQTLTAVKMGLYWAKSNARISTEAMENRLGELLEYTDLALDSVKSISTRLRPKALDTLPLHEAVDWLVRDFTRWSGIECASDIGRMPFSLSDEVKTTVFRVLQENLTNAARHSGASKVWVLLSLRDSLIELTVRDNGHGFDPAKSGTNRSFGIAGMRERCEYLGGSFTIFPAQEGGTIMVARLPYEIAEEDGHA